jgi:inhibitor of cysteine peptidase
VTYKQIDPFFVIDLQDPTNPIILGELKIPGYSTYLHPYDENHIIGIGMEGNTVKINLFDVEDVKNPIALDTYEFEAPYEYYWMYSSSLYEHKAFLFDIEKNLLVLPVSTDYLESAYVFNITSSDIELRGMISHLDAPISEDNTSKIEPYVSSYWKGDYRYSISRSLYIEDVLYTFSDAMIQMNDMNTLDEINSINLI